MKTGSANADIKRANQIKFFKYLLDKERASRQELINALELSLPTVLQIVRELTEKGLVTEVGEYDSTGGRKAKILGVRAGVYYAVGVEITKHHLQLVLVDMNHKVLAAEQLRYPYRDEEAYYQGLGNCVRQFLEKSGFSQERGNLNKILGVGLSVPGIIDPVDGTLRQSIILNIPALISTSKFTKYIPFETYCGQNADNAAFAEAKNTNSKNVICLFLNDTVGGGAYLDGKVYVGDGNKGAVLGHTVLVPSGRRCYCGKRGCLNAYCSALSLRRSPDTPLRSFFEDMAQGNDENARIWDEYLRHLAVGVANLRMGFECDILLGGDVSTYVRQYRSSFDAYLMENCLFEEDTAFLRFGKYNREVFAVGAAFVMIEKSIESGKLLG